MIQRCGSAAVHRSVIGSIVHNVIMDGIVGENTLWLLLYMHSY